MILFLKLSRYVVKNKFVLPFRQDKKVPKPWCVFVLLACLNPMMAQASLELKLAEPDWIFLLQSQPISPTDAQLEPNERNFAKQVQPLLQGQNYAQVAKAFEGRSMDQDSPALLQLRGQVSLSLKQFDVAERALLMALKSMPNLALAHRSLSMVYMQKKDYTKARQHLTRSIELGVADAQLYGQLAYINLNSGHAASAVAGYQQALYLEPDNQQWQQGLLYSWLNSHQYSAAQRLVEDMLEQGEHNNPAELWLLRSQIALQRGEAQQALASLEIALTLAPQTTANNLLAAKLHVQHGSVARAVELLSASLQVADKNSMPEVIEAVEQILPWLLSQQKLQQATSLLKVTASLKLPYSFDAKFNYFRGQLAIQQQNQDSAKRYLLKALELDPSLGDALLALAGVYQKQNLYTQANTYYVRASAIAEVKQQALLANAQMYIDQGQYVQALELLQQVQKLDPNRRDIQHNIRELQKIVRQGQYAS